MNIQRIVYRERHRILLAARGTIAALIAVTVAALLKLECPFWAAMTALIVIQPTRGLLLEKSYYRLVGTAVGSTAGLAMLLTSQSPAGLTIMLSFWLAGCVGAGNLVYGLCSYGAMVAGCTGAVVAMAGYNNPPHLHDLVFGRIACIAIGIIVSTTVTLFFTHRRSKRELLDRLQATAVAHIQWVALLVRGGEKFEADELRQDILMEISDIEGALDAAWAGSIDLKRRKRDISGLIVSLLSLLEAGTLAEDTLNRCNSAEHPWRESLANHLEAVAQQLEEHGTTLPEAADVAAVMAEYDAHVPRLGETVGELLRTLQLVIDEWETLSPDNERAAGKTFIRHRDWVEAGRAALRAGAAIAAIGAVWCGTGWAEGPLMLMATSIMVSFFSTHDRPSVLLSHIFCGASVGVAAAFICRLVLLPRTSDLLQQGLLCVPVLMIGIVALTHRRTAMGAMDFMLFFLFIMQPGVPSVPPPAAFVTGGLACLGGIAGAIIFFHFLLPVDPARRLRSILVAIVTDLNTMASADSLLKVEKSRVRMHHRILRMLANVRKLDDDRGAIIEGGLAALAVGRYLQRARETAINEDDSREVSDAIRDIALKLAIPAKKPAEILTMLTDAAITLRGAMNAHATCLQSTVQQEISAGSSTPRYFPQKSLFIERQVRPCHI